MYKSLLFLLMVVVATFKVAATDRFFIEDFPVQPSETTQVEILLENDVPFTAFQSDLYLPEGITLVSNSVSLTSRKSSDHTIATSQLQDGGIRLMSYSMELNSYSGNNGALVTLDVEVSPSIKTPVVIMLKNTLLTTTAGVETPVEDTPCTVFLRGDVNGDSSVSISDVTSLIDMLLAPSTKTKFADVNADGNVSISDVTNLIDILLTRN